MIRRAVFLAVLLAFLAAGVAARFRSAAPDNQPALKDVFKKDFMIGAALNQNQFTGRDQRGLPIITSQFNSITPENVLKWESVHPETGRYNFDAPDRFVAFGEKHQMFVVGHTLVWHSQTPRWVFEDGKGGPVDRETLLERMRDHIQTVVGRYKGRIKGWDVVNEALDEDGTLRQTPWMKIIGEEYLVKAFEFAHEADPSAQLYYNDYSLENEAKRKGAIDLIKKLKARSVPIYAVGLQGHDKMDWPTAQQQSETIVAFASLGVKVNITELDVDVLPRASQHRGADISLNVELRASLDPYANGLPDSVQQVLAKRYAELFAVFVKHRDSIDRVTFWGVTDGDSWLNNWPVRGRTSYPLLFDRDGKPKPAYMGVIKTAP
ncbi:MAG TPA: endo-1,4-beta-xylanase [Pyrinomonadaceae bacterium]|nr:endo-1,4-beta-xylanase [Pyrinomonadaceae bacterium]